MALFAATRSATPDASGADAAERAALGIPCIPGPGGVSICTGSPAFAVPTWDGVPLDVDLFLPPEEAGAGPHPLIVGIHGFGANKLAGFNGGPAAATALAADGYVVMAYSARGIGGSCGTPAGGLLPGCEKGWIHLADARYEVRDTQYLAGLLVDEGLVKPRRIGVTGTSYGGGQTLMLATLRDRVMLTSGKLVPWRSPAGVPMRIAAAAPMIGWSDLGYALAPTGRTLDFRPFNPYGRRPGIVKYSWLNGLYLTAQTAYLAPPGADPNADLRTWKAELDEGPPYDRELIRHVLDQIQRFHSAYYIYGRGPRSGRRRPAPTVIYNSWVDDIMPPAEALRYYNRVKHDFPRALISLVVTDEFAHPRGSLAGRSASALELRDDLFARYLKGERSVRPFNGVITRTQECAGSPRLGPFRTKTWHGQHRGEVVVEGGAPQSISSAGGSAVSSIATDPFFGGSACPTVPAEVDPGAATYLSAPAGGSGFTLLGSPTVKARIEVVGRFPQITARLWDMAPDGSQALVQHSPYVPRRHGVQVFQIQPNGWHFARGHVAKLELLGRDFPYIAAPTHDFEITVSSLTLELPVREHPNRGQIEPFAPPSLP